MSLTPLELLLSGGLVSLLTALFVRVWLGDRYVTRKECKLQREMLLAHKRDMNLIFAMLRAVISHMPGITPEQREKILNMKLPSSKE